MNNEEKNPAIENEAVVENNSTENKGAKKLSGGMIGAIIGGVVVVIFGNRPSRNPSSRQQ